MLTEYRNAIRCLEIPSQYTPAPSRPTMLAISLQWKMTVVHNQSPVYCIGGFEEQNFAIFPGKPLLLNSLL
jgi:hypothetical protein